MERGPIVSTLLEENAWIHGSLVSATEEVGGGGGDLAAEVLSAEDAGATAANGRAEPSSEPRGHR